MPMEPKIVPLVQPIGARFQSLNVDSRVINGFAEAGQRKGDVHVYKRPGFRVWKSVAPGIARGLTEWQGQTYAIVGGTVYKDGVSIGTVSDTGTYTFTSTLGTTPKLFFHNVTNAYFYDGTTLAPVVDSPYPANVTPSADGSVYLDGTVYVMNLNNAKIYGSLAAANAPDDWDDLNVIQAQIEPMKGVYLAKNLVYVLALKEHYTEAFYDAGNPTGSPLAPVQGAKMNFGCYNPGTVRDVGGDLIWIADSGEGYPCAVMVSNLKVEVISTPPVDRILANSYQDAAWTSWNFRIAGHRFYGVSFLGSSRPPDPPRPDFTLVFDLTSRLWYQWTQANGRHLPYMFSCQHGSEAILLHESNGHLVCPEETVYKDEDDANGQFTFEIYTPNYDAETRLIKTQSQLTLIGDQAPTTVQMAYSDDDYATWSFDFPFNMGLDRADQVDLGAFTKRAFRFRHTDNTACRIESAELYISGGVQP